MFCDTTVDSNLSQLIDKPSHIKNNILDLIFWQIIMNMFTVHDINLPSDHYLITTGYSLPLHSPLHHSMFVHNPRFSWDKADWPGLSNYFFNIYFSSCFVPNMDTSWALLQEVILVGCSKLIPLCTSRNLCHPPWYTPHIVHSIKKIRSLRRLPCIAWNIDSL